MGIHVDPSDPMVLQGFVMLAPVGTPVPVSPVAWHEDRWRGWQMPNEHVFWTSVQGGCACGRTQPVVMFREMAPVWPFGPGVRAALAVDTCHGVMLDVPIVIPCPNGRRWGLDGRRHAAWHIERFRATPPERPPWRVIVSALGCDPIEIRPVVSAPAAVGG